MSRPEGKGVFDRIVEVAAMTPAQRNEMTSRLMSTLRKARGEPCVVCVGCKECGRDCCSDCGGGFCECEGHKCKASIECADCGHDAHGNEVCMPKRAPDDIFCRCEGQKEAEGAVAEEPGIWEAFCALNAAHTTTGEMHVAGCEICSTAIALAESVLKSVEMYVIDNTVVEATRAKIKALGKEA